MQTTQQHNPAEAVPTAGAGCSCRPPLMGGVVRHRIFAARSALTFAHCFDRTISSRSGDDFRRRESAGRDFNRIVGHYQRPHGARAVAFVAQVLRIEHFVERDLFAAREQIAIAPQSPFVFVGREENLALGIRKHDRPLVASLGDDVVSVRGFALPDDQLGPDCRIVGRVLDRAS